MERGLTKKVVQAEESHAVQNLLRRSVKGIKNAALVGAALTAGALFIPTNAYSQSGVRNILLSDSVAAVEASIPEHNGASSRPVTNEEEARSRYNIKKGGAVEVLNTANWAGYVVASDFAKPQPIINQVSAEWVIPEVRGSKKEVEMVQWIGIGGGISGDSTLIQVGTTEHSKDGVNTYYAGIDMLPNTILGDQKFPCRNWRCYNCKHIIDRGNDKKMESTPCKQDQR